MIELAAYVFWYPILLLNDYLRTGALLLEVDAKIGLTAEPVLEVIVFKELSFFFSVVYGHSFKADLSKTYLVLRASYESLSSLKL